MSNKHTEKTVHIERIQDQDILEELESEIESGGRTRQTVRSEREKQTSSTSGKRTARPFSEVKDTMPRSAIREERSAEDPKKPSDPVEPTYKRPAEKPEPTVTVDDKFDTKGLDEVLEFIDTDSYKNQRTRRRVQNIDS